MNISIGPKSRFKLFSFLNKMNIENIFIIVGKNSSKEKLISTFLEKIKREYKINIYYKKNHNPEFFESFKASKKIKTTRSNAIIAIGGGSVIDTAKLISAFEPYDINDSKKIMLGKKNINKNLIPLIVIPTTSGTGSEATHFAVVYYKEKKYSLASKKILPLMCFLDSELTYSMSKYIAASTGFDALSQAIESAWSINSSAQSKKYSYEAIRIIRNNIVKSVNNKNTLSRNKMIKAAYLSGKAINITKTTAPHALSYKLASKLNLSHGHSVAILLGYFFELNYQSKKLSNKIKKNTMKKNMENIFLNFGVSSAKAAKEKWYKLMKDCGLEINFSKLNLYKKKDIIEIVNSINIERLNNHPVVLSKKDLYKLFE